MYIPANLLYFHGENIPTFASDLSAYDLGVYDNYANGTCPQKHHIEVEGKITHAYNHIRKREMRSDGKNGPVYKSEPRGSRDG